MNKARLFSRYTASGYRVELLHSVGPVALAKIHPKQAAPFFAARWSHTFATGFTPAETLAALRLNREAHLAASDALHQQLIKPEDLIHHGLNLDEVTAFCLENDLRPWESYPYGKLKQIALSGDKSNCQKFSRMLKRANQIIQSTSTNPVSDEPI